MVGVAQPLCYSASRTCSGKHQSSPYKGVLLRERKPDLGVALPHVTCSLCRLSHQSDTEKRLALLHTMPLFPLLRRCVLYSSMV